MTDSVEALSRRLAKLTKDVRRLSTQPQLGHSSFDDGAIQQFDPVTGALVQVVGTQWDGTKTVAQFNGPTPPAPAGLTPTPFPGGVNLFWGGGFVDNEIAPMDFFRVEYHVSREQGFDTDATTPVRTVETPRGGQHDVILPEPGIWYAKMFTRTQSGKRSVDSAEIQFEVTMADQIEPPTSSPELTVTGADTSLVVQAETISASDVLTYYISTDENVPILPENQYGQPTRSTVLQVFRDAEGNQLSPSVRYYFRVVRSNEAGAADPSPVASGMLDSSAAEALITSMLVAGFILTGRIQIGTATFDADTGITLPQPDGGTIHFPVNGIDFATITAHAILKSATIEDNLNLYGLSQLYGNLRISNGIVRPSQPITPGHDWASIKVNHPNGTMWQYGLTDSIAGTNWISTYSYGSAYVLVINKAEGGVIAYKVADTTGFVPEGGITRIGESYFILGQDFDRRGRWFVRELDSTFQRIREWEYADNSSSPYSPAIGTDGINVVIARAAGVGSNAGLPFVRTYNKTTGALINTVIGSLEISTDYTGVVITQADFGVTPRIVLTHSRGIHVFNANTGNRIQGDEFRRAGNTDIVGFTYADGSFWHMGGGRVWRYTGNVADVDVDLGYSFADVDGVVHETQLSNLVPYRWPARSMLTFQSAGAPDAGVADPTEVDKANRVRVYAAYRGATPRLQVTLGVGVRSGSLSTLLTNTKTPELTNGFDLADKSAGHVFSAAADGIGPLIDLLGDGQWRLDPISRDTLPQSGRANTGTFEPGVTKSIQVTFPKTFPAGVVPEVFLTQRITNPTLVQHSVDPDSETESGFRILAHRVSGTNPTNISWLAVPRYTE